MATVFIDQSGMELRVDGTALKLYHDGDYQRSLPLKLLDRVILQGDVRFSARVLTAITECGASVVMLSKRNSRRVAMVLGGVRADARLRLAQYALVDDQVHVLTHAKQLVSAKIRAQSRLLSDALARRPDLRKPLRDAIAALRARHEMLGRVAGLPAVLGIEGAASAAYFQAYLRLYPDALGFKGRNRRPPRDPVNAVLSLTYTLLHYEAVSVCHAAGLDPYVGYLHAPAYGRESLACDLIEPLRPVADAWVHGLFRERELRADHFRKDKGACLLDKAGRARFYPVYESFAHTQRRRLRRLARLVVRGIRATKTWEWEDAGVEDALS